MSWLGDLLSGGKNRTRADELYKEAMKFMGDDAEWINAEAAKPLLRQAADLGSLDAKLSLGAMLFDEYQQTYDRSSLVESAKLMVQSAKSGHAPTKLFLADIMRAGLAGNTAAREYIRAMRSFC